MDEETESAFVDELEAHKVVRRVSIVDSGLCQIRLREEANPIDMVHAGETVVQYGYFISGYGEDSHTYYCWPVSKEPVHTEY